MTKNELITLVADKTQMTKTAAATAVEATFDAITTTLRQGQDVKIMGFGNFKVVSQYGYTDEPGRWDAWPGAFIWTGAEEDGVDGTVVIDAGDMLLDPFMKYVSVPITLTIKAGYITDIAGGGANSIDAAGLFSFSRVVGLAALLAGLDPQAVHRWYLGVYIDAFEWVELPNTLGMSQFADGGKLDESYVAELARRADVLVIAPATADCIANLAQGRTPDMVTLTALATTAPLLVAPAMDNQMWEHAATQANVETVLQNLWEHGYNPPYDLLISQADISAWTNTANVTGCPSRVPAFAVTNSILLGVPRRKMRVNPTSRSNRSTSGESRNIARSGVHVLSV